MDGHNNSFWDCIVDVAMEGSRALESRSPRREEMVCRAAYLQYTLGS